MPDLPEVKLPLRVEITNHYSVAHGSYQEAWIRDADGKLLAVPQVQELVRLANAAASHAAECERLRGLVRDRLARTEGLIALGKGTWPEKDYVKDEQWACWQHEAMTLKTILHAFGSERPAAMLDPAAGKGEGR